MSIEKMLMVDLVGPIEDIHQVSKQIVLSKSVHIVNAFQEIENTNFKVSATEENIDTLIDICSIKPYSDSRDYSETNNKIKKLNEICKVKDPSNIFVNDLILNYEVLENEVKDIDSAFAPMHNRLQEIEEQKKNMKKYLQNLLSLTELDINLEEMLDVKQFSFQMYKITKENFNRLKANYENVPSIVVNIKENRDQNVIAAFTPHMLRNESERFFKSLNCEAIELPKEYCGTPKQICEVLNENILKIEQEINELSHKLQEISGEYTHRLHIVNKSMELENKSWEVKNNAARTQEFFYISGWIPKSFLAEFKSMMECFGDRIVISERNLEEVNNPNVIPPTKLKNNSLIRPFEALVSMYGTPSYNEIDPTVFLSITYVIIFGMMFGDLGQGLVFFFAGLFLKYNKHRPNLGGVLARLGISSSIFGMVYGSFFGFENVVPAFVLRPMDNIMEVLTYAIIFGCGLLIIGYVYSLINNFKKRDVENGIFGQNGVSGFVLYVCLLTFAYTKISSISIMPDSVWITLIVILLLVIFLRQPIASLVTGRRPLFHDSKEDYFIEGSFGIAEVLLTMFSNTISFIRVGAFALNHVGLFLAFEALAKMMHNNIGSAAMYILGNLIIIGLEGLIVFIQALRLEYYELFSKYYEGGGIPFEPIKLSGDLKLSIDQKMSKTINKELVFEK